MILVVQSGLSEQSIGHIFTSLSALGLTGQTVRSGQHLLVVVEDDTRGLPSHHFSQIEGIEKVVRIQPQCPIAVDRGSPSVKFFNGVTIGGGTPVVIAGPCSVEGLPQLLDTAASVREAGADMLRGGAFKPRTSPYDFRGLGLEGLNYLREARQATGLPVVSEVMSPEQVERAEPFVDMYQIGARNMYNYELLREVGTTRKPVLLKRGMSATVDELLQAAEYIMLEGNLQVVLCERGIRTFETCTRNTIDLSAVAALKSMTKLPVLVDPSHGTGRRELVRPMARAAIAAGADGLLIEVHNDPCKALSDGMQAVTAETLKEIVRDVYTIHQAVRSCEAGFSPESTLMRMAGAAEAVGKSARPVPCSTDL